MIDLAEYPIELNNESQDRAVKFVILKRLQQQKNLKEFIEKLKIKLKDQKLYFFITDEKTNTSLHDIKGLESLIQNIDLM